LFSKKPTINKRRKDEQLALSDRQTLTIIRIIILPSSSVGLEKEKTQGVAANETRQTTYLMNWSLVSGSDARCKHGCACWHLLPYYWEQLGGLISGVRVRVLCLMHGSFLFLCLGGLVSVRCGCLNR
jgi:hypothetical protein